MISIIISFKNKSSLTIKCLETIIKFCDKENYEILLIDTGSKKNELNRIQDFVNKSNFLNFKFLFWKKEFNWQKVNNFGAQKAKGEFLLFLNNDIEFTKDSVVLLKKSIHIASRKNIGVVGCRMMFPDNTVQHAGGIPEAGYWHSHVGYKEKLKSLYTKDKVYTYLTGAFHLIQKKKFIEIGKYDEKFKVLGGDIEFCVRSKLKGYKNYYIGSKSVIHHESVTRKINKIHSTDFILLHNSLIKIFENNRSQLPKFFNVLKAELLIEKITGMPLIQIKKTSKAFVTKSLILPEIIPALPLKRKKRITVVVDTIKDFQMKSIVKEYNNVKLLMISYNSTNKKIDGKNIIDLENSLKKFGCNVFWLETKKDDLILCSRKFYKMLKKNFPSNKIIEI